MSQDPVFDIARARTSSSEPSGLVLHLGAPRTGTTRLQTILDMNRDVLAKNGVVALTPPRLGKRISPTIRNAMGLLSTKRNRPIKSFFRIRKARKIFSGLVAESCPDNSPHKIIVSDEGILGPTLLPTGFGLYPAAYQSLVAVRKMLRRPPSELHLTLRSYDTFLVSVYTMDVLYRRGKVPPFDEIKETLLAVHRGWPDVIADVNRAFPGTPLKLTKVEQDSMESRVSDLVGRELFATFRLDGDERVHVAPTVEAMAAANRLKGATGTRPRSQEGHAIADDLIARYANGTRFDPLTEAERSRLAERYAKDMTNLIG